MPSNNDIDSVVESAYNSEKCKQWGEQSIDSNFKVPKGTVATEENISLLYCVTENSLRLVGS